MSKSINKRTAFTLIEILVVISIVVVLAALIFGVFSSVRNKARMSSCASNLHQIYLACSMYASDNAGMVPGYPSKLRYTGAAGDVAVEKSQELVSSLHPYIHSNSIWRCPSDNTTSIPETVTYSGGNILLSHSTSYDYQGWEISEQGVRIINPDSSNSNGLQGTMRPLIQDDARCPTNDGKYNEYNHNGWWNRVYCDGHVKQFNYDCSIPNSPAELP